MIRSGLPIIPAMSKTADVAIRLKFGESIEAPEQRMRFMGFDP